MMDISNVEVVKLSSRGHYYFLWASEQSERDTLRSVQSRIADIYIYNILYIVHANFVLITRKEGRA